MIPRWIVTISFISICLSETIDNGLTGAPIVECGSENLTIRFDTQNVFEGHVYVKGHYGNKKCRRDATLQKGVNLTVRFDDCDVVRQRSNSPRGIMVTSTVIITFHPMFITKVDKSYKVQCFYAEMERSVTNQLDVKEGKEMEKTLTVVIGGQNDTNKLPIARHPPSNDNILDPNIPIEHTEINVPLPECRYQVLTESKDGEPVKFATVGQTVYHEWSCEDSSINNTSSSQLFCATVHSCMVREEGGREVQLLDENGCAVDKYLLNNLDYTSDLTGGQISQVFKFADQNSLFFQCQIRLSIKEGGSCIRSSDHCPPALRGKRSVKEENNRGEVDVISQHMTVFDIDEPINPEAASKLTVPPSWAGGEVCLSPLVAGSLLSVLLSLVFVTAISIGLLCLRPRTVVAKLSG